MFRLKDKSTLFGIDKETSTHDTPVFKKDLEGGVMAEANRDGTIFVQKGLSTKQTRDAVEHEKVHLDQMAAGRLQYDENTVTWKKDTRSPARVYQRLTMNEGDPNFEWEKEAYKK
jgi:hypothetical protein|tara:strand:+ start:1691 stop:2035 length:345 start_codon:yes stop_codon:yes gene_type:complete